MVGYNDREIDARPHTNYSRIMDAYLPHLRVVRSPGISFGKGDGKRIEAAIRSFVTLIDR